MEKVDYKNLLFDLVSGLKSKPEYMRSISIEDAAFNEKYFEGMLMAYHLVLDEVLSTIENYGDNPSLYGLDKDLVNGVLDIKPIV